MQRIAVKQVLVDALDPSKVLGESRPVMLPEGTPLETALEGLKLAANGMEALSCFSHEDVQRIAKEGYTPEDTERLAKLMEDTQP